MKQLAKYAGLAAMAITFTIVASSSAQAQTSSGEFSAGYQYTHAPENSIPGGWYADYAVPVKGMWAVFGEVNGAYEDGGKQHVYGGGIRYMDRMMPSVRPFGQVLFGATTFSGFGSTETDFTMQFGGGVDIPVDSRWGVRVGADYRPIFFEGGHENQFRFVVGAVFPGR